MNNLTLKLLGLVTLYFSLAIVKADADSFQRYLSFCHPDTSRFGKMITEITGTFRADPKLFVLDESKPMIGHEYAEACAISDSIMSQQMRVCDKHLYPMIRKFNEYRKDKNNLCEIGNELIPVFLYNQDPLALRNKLKAGSDTLYLLELHDSVGTPAYATWSKRSGIIEQYYDIEKWGKEIRHKTYSYLEMPYSDWVSKSIMDLSRRWEISKLVRYGEAYTTSPVKYVVLTRIILNSDRNYYIDCACFSHFEMPNPDTKRYSNYQLRWR